MKHENDRDARTAGKSSSSLTIVRDFAHMPNGRDLVLDSRGCIWRIRADILQRWAEQQAVELPTVYMKGGQNGTKVAELTLRSSHVCRPW